MHIVVPESRFKHFPPAFGRSRSTPGEHGGWAESLAATEELPAIVDTGSGGRYSDGQNFFPSEVGWDLLRCLAPLGSSFFRASKL